MLNATSVFLNYHGGSIHTVDTMLGIYYHNQSTQIQASKDLAETGADSNWHKEMD